jgi:hypothetical protein
MIVVTSHASLMEDGRLYLGYGAAAEATKRIPDIELHCGAQIQEVAREGVYGFLPVMPSQPERRLVGFGLFQTQYSWEEPSDQELIRYSMEGLRAYLRENSDLRVRMNFPTIEQGKQSPDAIASLLLPLPDTLTVCHQGEIQRAYPENFPGFKAIYLQVERLLLGGNHNLAVEYLVRNGFDMQSAFEQVSAVQRCIRERQDREADHVRQYRSSRV